MTFPLRPLCASAAFLFLLATLPPLVAGQATIRGLVIEDELDDTLPGVNVIILELDRGAATGIDGTYEIVDVPPGTYTLEARYIGFAPESKEVTVADGETAEVDFTLGASTLELDEVIVTGTGGNARRREIGNSISQIDAAQIEATPTTDFGDLLQGRAAGVTVMDNSGQAGAGATIRLRGVNSVTQGNTPLIYIDGVRVTNAPLGADGETNQAASALNDLNPDDILRIEVIKGPAATTLYGTEASSGVIQVFTKRGASGRPQVDFSVRQGFNNMGTAGPEELSINDCTGEPGCPEGGDWFRNGHLQSYNLSVRGGTNELNYFVSGKWGSEEGVIAPQGSEGYSVRGNFDFTPIEDLRISFVNSYSYRNTRWIPDGNNAEGLLLNVLRGDKGYTPDNNDALTLEMLLNTEVNHFTSGLSFNWTPLQGMLHQLKGGIDYVESAFTEERPFGYFYEPLGNRENDTELLRNLTLDYIGSYNRGLTPSISSSSSWGGQLYKDTYQQVNGFGYEFAGPGRKDLDSGARTEAFETRRTITSGGFFGQQRFGYQDRLFVTVGLRVDGHSTFGEDFGLAPYPKVSGTYIVSDHGFWPAWWEALKLRAAYGESGKAPGVFDALRTYESVAGDEGEPAVTPGNIGNAEIGPERSRETELGFETALLGGRVTADFTWYRQRTYDALLAVQPTPSAGFTNTQLQNVGEIGNKGIEAQLGLVVVDGRNVQWDVGGHFSTSYSEAVDLGEIQTIPIGWRQFVRPGYPVPALFQDVVTNPDELGADPDFEERYIGPTYPTRVYGLNTTLTLWQRFAIDVVGEGQAGHYLYSGTAYQNTRRRVWPPCLGIQEQIDAGDTAGLTAGEIGLCDPNATTYGMWGQPADFFKIRSASISYRLPAKWLPSQIRLATLRFQARNLFTFTDYPGLDPEAFEDGSADALYRQEYYNLPPARSFTFVFKVGF